MSVLAIGGAALLGGFFGFRDRIRGVFAGLVEWEGKRGKLTVGDPRSLAVLGSIGVLSLAFFGGVGIGLGGGVVSTAGSQAGAFEYGAPNAPSIDVIVDDTSTWRVTFSAFVGSGDDTQDSISVTVLRSGAADTLFHAVSGVQTVDTISDNADLKADTTYRVLGRQKGANGGWSNADTLSVQNIVASILFMSDWSDATGGEASGAIFDGGRWTFLTHFGDSSYVMAATGLGFPPAITNVIRMATINDSGSEILVTVDSLPIPDVGESLYYRWYFRYVAPQAWQGTHAIQDGSAQPFINWEFVQDSIFGSDTTYWAGWYMSSSGSHNPSPNNGWGDNGLTSWDKDVVYRWELRFHRTGATEHQIHVRVYSISGETETLVAEDADFSNGAGTTLGDNPTFDIGTLSSLATLHLGINGDDGVSPGFAVHSYIGGVCIRADDWCGAYDSVVDESEWNR